MHLLLNNKAYFCCNTSSFSVMVWKNDGRLYNVNTRTNACITNHKWFPEWHYIVLHSDSCKKQNGTEEETKRGRICSLLVDRRGKIVEISENCGMTLPPGKTDARASRDCVPKLCFKPGRLFDSTSFPE